MGHNYDLHGYTTSDNDRINRNLKATQHMPPEDRRAVTEYPGAPGEGPAVPFPTINPDRSDIDQYQDVQSKRDIETIYKQITGEKLSQISAEADGWVRVHQLLTHVGNQLNKETNALVGDGNGGGSWTSDAAKLFAQRGPGATLKSIEDWQEAAQANIKGLRHIENTLPGHQKKIQQLWHQYQNDLGDAERTLQNANSDDFDTIMSAARKLGVPMQAGGVWAVRHSRRTHNDILDKQDIVRLQQQALQNLRAKQHEYNIKAQRIAYAMASDYDQAIYQHIGHGAAGRYEGPVDAVADNHRIAPPSGGPATPGGGPTAPGGGPTAPGGAPTPPGGAPTPPPGAPDTSAQFLRNQQTQQAARTAPGTGPLLAGRTALAPQPTTTTAPNLAPGTAPTAPDVPPGPVGLPAVATADTPRAPGGTGKQPPGGNETVRSGNPAAAREAARTAPGTPDEGLAGRSGMRGGVPRPPLTRTGQLRAPKPPVSETEMGARPGTGRAGTTPPVLNNKRGITRPPGAPVGEGETGAAPGARRVGTGSFSAPRAGTTPPVLNNKRPAVRPAVADAEAELGGRPGSTRAGTTPSVLNPRGAGPRTPGMRGPGMRGPGALPGQAARSGPQAPDPTRSAARNTSVFGQAPDEKGATEPVVRRPTPAAAYESNLEEVPTGMRPAGQQGAVDDVRPSGPPPSRADLAARARRTTRQEGRQKKTETADEVPVVATDDVWEVETPGGPVVANEAPRDHGRTQAGPSLGQGGAR